jgi:hypothetical protein
LIALISNAHPFDVSVMSSDVEEPI